MTHEGQFWILYLQPEPESGERIAIALAIRENGFVSLDYDNRFSKAQCTFPSFDSKLLQFYLQSMERDLASHRGDPVELILSSYAPQIAISSPRRIATPLNASTRLNLLKKFVLLPSREKVAAVKRDDNVAKQIVAFVTTHLGRIPDNAERYATSDRLFGKRITGTEAVAVAIPRGNGWVLIDGVDLNQSQPQAAINRADAVARTFWNYAREMSSQIQSVGIVLNGNSRARTSTHEAHDYALHRFKQDSTAAIDGNSISEVADLRRMVPML
jgi:hypothetical protein